MERGAERREPPCGYLDARSEFARTDDGGHMALFYEDRAEQLPVAAAFVETELGRNRKCLYLVHENPRERVRATFEAVGIDVDARVEAGDLRIRDATEVYLADGASAEEIIGTLDAASRASLEDGYDGFAVAGENTWSFRGGAAFEGIIEFEIEFDERCPELPATTLCQYDLDRFDEASIAKAIRTHEHVVYRGTVCENPYYVPPERFVEGEGDDRRASARLMLEQTHELARNRREAERSRERLSVVDRVLRHNIRNDLNVVLGALDRLQREWAPDAEARELIGTAEAVAEGVVDHAEKARYVQRTMEASRLEPTAVGPTVEAAVADVTERHPEAEITVTGATDRTVLADANLDRA